MLRYRKHVSTLPLIVQDPKSGQILQLSKCELHHPAGRRKHTFLFVVPVSPETHRWIHENPHLAETLGLLWCGRNSKQFRHLDAIDLLSAVPYPETFKACLQAWAKTL